MHRTFLTVGMRVLVKRKIMLKLSPVRGPWSQHFSKRPTAFDLAYKYLHELSEKILFKNNWRRNIMGGKLSWFIWKRPVKQYVHVYVCF